MSLEKFMIFKQRRLLCISLFAILSVFLADLLPSVWTGVAFYLLAGAAFVCFLLSFRIHRALSPALALLLAACAMLSAYGAESKREALSDMDGKRDFLSVTVLSKEEGHLVFLSEGERCRVRVKFTSPTDAEIGDTLYGPAVFSLSEKDSVLFSRGLFGTVRFLECRNVGEVHGLRYVLGRWRDTLSLRIREALPGDGGALFTALLLGIREDLPADFERDMTRIGTTHMLSLSGLHLVILTTGLAFLLQRIRLRKGWRLLILALFSVFFMILTGLSASLLRAGLMFLFSLFPLFLREERDSLTSLAAAVACIVLVEPYAVRDISLWLSALSTLGILLLFDRYRQTASPASAFQRILRYVLLSVGVTLAATVATLPLTLCVFGTLPLLSPLANLVLSPLMQLALYLSVFAALLGFVPILAPIYSFICKLVFTITEFLADIPNSVISVDQLGVSHVFFVLFILVMAYFLFCPRKRFQFRVPLFLCLGAALAVLGIGAFDALASRNALTFSYFADESADCDVLLFEAEGECLLTVFSDLSVPGTPERKALSRCAGEVDGFLLPFYTKDCARYLESLLVENKVWRLYVPSPRFTAEEEISREILAVAAQENVPTVVYRDDLFLTEEISVSLFSAWGDPQFLFTVADVSVSYGIATEAQGASDVCVLGCYGAEERPLSPRPTLSADTKLLSPSPSALPFDDPRGVLFAKEYRVLIPYAE